VARIGVAATAPFGVDVLERLAAQHEIAFDGGHAIDDAILHKLGTA